MKRAWCHQRSKEWWKMVSSGQLGEQWWRENRRMHRSTFVFLCRKLEPYIERQCTVMRLPISIEQRVAVAIWSVATNVEYRTISELFGIGKATACVIMNDTCQAIVKYLMPHFVTIYATGRQIKRCYLGFEA